MNQQLSPHFHLTEFTYSQNASRAGIDNTPGPAEVLNLVHAAQGMEAVRTLLHSQPITVTSGYRSPAVNRLAKGSSKTSAHMTGHAVDFICPAYGTPLEICERLAESGLEFDQLIQEGTWVHIAFGPGKRRQLLTKAGGGYSTGIGEAV
jgi:zinc D-Ala-D-Ala carboxypeptidase